MRAWDTPAVVHPQVIILSEAAAGIQLLAQMVEWELVSC